MVGVEADVSRTEDLRWLTEIADMVVFLASGKAGYVNATTVTVDGGRLRSGLGL